MADKPTVYGRFYVSGNSHMKFVGSELPPKTRRGRAPTQLLEIAERVKGNPGNWFMVKEGTYSTLHQMSKRLTKMFPDIQTEIRTVPGTHLRQAKCYACLNLDEERTYV